MTAASPAANSTANPAVNSAANPAVNPAEQNFDHCLG